MNSESNSEVKLRFYSVKQLAGMGLPGYPGTERAWLDRVKNENWIYVELKGQGRGGIRREYTPPPEVQTLIEARQRGELPPSGEKAEQPAASYVVSPDNIAQFEVMLKRVAEATQATVRVSKQFDFALPVEWTSLIQELMALYGLTEAGAKRVIEALKRQA